MEVSLEFRISSPLTGIVGAYYDRLLLVVRATRHVTPENVLPVR